MAVVSWCCHFAIWRGRTAVNMLRHVPLCPMRPDNGCVGMSCRVHWLVVHLIDCLCMSGCGCVAVWQGLPLAEAEQSINAGWG